MSGAFRVGTRRSALARAQTEGVLARLGRRHPALRWEVVPLDTSGDRDRRPGRSPDFTDALDRALLDRTIDLAVHSAKDLPAELPPGLALLATPRRADPRDCLVGEAADPGRELPRGARIGSSSPRRRAQLLRWRPDLSVVELRGNVDTRLAKVRAGEVDAAVLAVAGLLRLGRPAEIGRILPASRFLPAPAQGALAIVGRAGDRRAAAAVRGIDHPATRAAVRAERAFAAAVGGDCLLPLGALATVRGPRLSIVGEVLAPDGRTSLRADRRGPVARSAALGAGIGAALRARGARALMTSAAGSA